MVQSKQEAEQQLRELRELLLEEEAEAHVLVMNRIETIQKQIMDDERFKERLGPHLESQLDFLQQNFPDLFGKYLGKAIKNQIRDSQDEIIDALYPIIGKLISKFIRTEIERISQRIDQQLQDPFSLKNLKLRIKAFFSGISYEEMLIRETAQSTLEEIFLIRKQDGMLLGHFSLDEVTHPDMIAGMLTGIKQFIEHAFEKQSQELNTLEYDKYNISINNFQTFYFAAVIEGPLHAHFEKRLQSSIYAFSEQNDIFTDQPLNKQITDQISSALKEHFYGFNQVDQ